MVYFRANESREGAGGENPHEQRRKPFTTVLNRDRPRFPVFQKAEVKSYKYDAFGNIISETGPAFNRGFTYTSRERHARSGFYYYRARFYDPQTGRFITQDPIGHLGGVNLYAYVGNSPVYYVDPHGLFFERFWDNPEERANHMDKAISMEKFIRYTQGKSLEQLQHERDAGLASDRGAHGPNTPFRYVINPNNPNEVIDMRHFLVVGPQGEFAGLVGEILQLRGDNQSAFDAQDFLSNALGADFFDGYDPNRALDAQLREYFSGKGKKTCEE